MATTHEIDKLPATASAAYSETPTFAAGALVLQEQKMTTEKGVTKLQSVYTVGSGDPLHPMFLAINNHYDPNADSGLGRTFVTLRLSATNVTAVDGVETEYVPEEAGVFWNYRGRGPSNVADTLALILAVQRLSFGVTAGAPDSTQILKLANGNNAIVP
jgi:hypothetical protein